MAQLVEAGMLSYWLVQRGSRLCDGTSTDVYSTSGVASALWPRSATQQLRRRRHRSPQDRNGPHGPAEVPFRDAVPEGERFDTVAALAFIEHVHDPAGYCGGSPSCSTRGARPY